ncbi:MAG: cell division protein FtsZ [Gammaproteobacteria bacterium]|nr:cell division protein FtsZ [Gammaproteobacteria bacterium]MDE0713265.1 cell division protein FtsZ [Gammaproteobacteria bacterium]MXX15673.1 cell division protein FtsZ [Gammaproteobacteria bacterium]MYH90449.1 cell division protein FtsZ [Gammaproteobacteria bacterium]
MFELVEAVSQQAVIKVIGVGGGGGNAVEHMLRADLDGVDFINANTDAQMLSRSNAPTILQLGENLTKGLGAGANPEIGRQAAMEDRDRISDAINGADMIFITAGMGGGTGTGATPVIAELAREKGALTVAVVTKPFPFEGQKRMDLAMLGIEDLQEHVDSLITVPNEKVLAVMGHEASLVDAFAKANEVLFNAVQGISELITRPGLINVDFADVRTVMAEMGRAMMGSATANGENRAVEAARQAISSPLLEDINLYGAKGLLVNITAGPDMAIGEFEAVGNSIHEYAAPDANLVIGTAFDPEMQGDLRVTMVATGLCDSSSPKPVVEKPVKAAPPPPKEEKAEEKLPKGAMVPPRKFARAGGASMAEAAQLDLDHLEIPAFLRRQAD